MTNLFIELEDETPPQPQEHATPEQRGPLRWYDTYMRCASRGCSSATYLKLGGIPYCQMHALRKMNEMLIEQGVE